MKILGISTSHDAGAAVIEDGKILSAINEERLNREKLFWGMPRLSILEVLKNSNTRPEGIDYVAIAGITPSAGPSEIRSGDFRYVSSKKRMMTLLAKTRIPATDSFKSFFRIVMKRMRQERKLLEYIKNLGIDCPYRFVEHHIAHAASAYYTSPFKDPLIITTDAAGDGISSLVCTATKDCGIQRQAETSFYHSPGKIYSYVTYNLGFRTGRHEGKITGLAAYGNPIKTFHIFNNIIKLDTKNLKFQSRMGCWGGPAAMKLHEMTWGNKREDIAAGVQKMIEEKTTGLARAALERFQKRNIVLAGGVYANVRVNQEIVELDGVDSVFIHPHMGDGGLATGAALQVWAQLMIDKGKTPKPVSIDNVYFGMEFSNEQIEKALKKAGLKYQESKDIESEIAHLMKNKKIVGRFHGRMEYGPRALGSRTILADATDRTINNWLNKRLYRCYDDQTEILTNEGWKLMKDIKKDEIVATLNRKTNQLEYQKIQEKVSYPFEGEMYHIKNDKVELFVTPGHNMWIKEAGSEKFKFKKIEEVSKLKNFFVQTGSIVGSFPHMSNIEIFNQSLLEKKHIKRKYYKGKVYCVTVPNHIIFVRRNGRPLFCGNTEFMPFAPVIMKEHSEDYFKNFKPGETAAQFMTITFDVTDKGVKEVPGVVHIDRTARPQTITEKQNKSYYNVLKAYNELTGLPICVNTSFNMHEEPIVATPEDAIRSFKVGAVDVLAIGDFLVDFKENKK